MLMAPLSECGPASAMAGVAWHLKAFIRAMWNHLAALERSRWICRS